MTTNVFEEYWNIVSVNFLEKVTSDVKYSCAIFIQFDFVVPIFHSQAFILTLLYLESSYFCSYGKEPSSFIVSRLLAFIEVIRHVTLRKFLQVRHGKSETLKIPSFFLTLTLLLNSDKLK